MNKSEAGKLGFQKLVDNRFDGDADLARLWVGDLGKAAFFYSFRPIFALSLLDKWRGRFDIDLIVSRWETVF
jgi:hypothetical protein